MGNKYDPILGKYRQNDADSVVIPTQTYQTITYNSNLTDAQCAARGGNVFNDFEVMDEYLNGPKSQAGPKLLIGEQDELMPVGTWDWDEVTVKGKNLAEYNAGGYTWTFPEGCHITGAFSKAEGIRILSTATTHAIWEPSSVYTWIVDTVANIHSTSYPFISSAVAGQNILAVRNSGRIQLLAGGVENVQFTGGAFAQTVILSMGDGAVVTNDVLKSTNAVVYLPIVGSDDQALSNPSPTHANLVVGFLLELNLTNAAGLMNTPAGNIAATNVQAAINELDAEKPQISSGTAAPGTTPTKVGDVYIDTNNKKLYFATGTTNSSDWTIAN